MVSDNSHLQVLIHQASKRWSQAPFRRSKGQVQRVLFHPLRPFFFVATQRSIRIYNLLKQELTKTLLTNCQWVSSIALHPGGKSGPVHPPWVPSISVSTGFLQPTTAISQPVKQYFYIVSWVPVSPKRAHGLERYKRTLAEAPIQDTAGVRGASDSSPAQ